MVELSIPALRKVYEEDQLTPTTLVETLYSALEKAHGSFIALASLTDLQDRCRELEKLPKDERNSLWGVPFAVKDNIDAAPFKTTAACPTFSYQPTHSAPAVQALLDAGGIMVGKTNMDQFAAGLVGTRTPYGTAQNAFDDRFVPGGSSSGSGALVGAGLVSFALGTDTAGSGRVPAMLNGCVGIKPTVGKVSSAGVVPACRSLDCISCFARTVEDGALVVSLMEIAKGDRTVQKAGSLSDSCWRPIPKQLRPILTGYENGSTPHMEPQTAAGKFRFGVPGTEHLDFNGPGGRATAKEYHRAFQDAIQRMEACGGELVAIDFTPFAEVADLLYSSAFIAERYSGIREFLKSSEASVSGRAIEEDGRMERVTAAIMAAGLQYSAADVFQAFAQLAKLQAQARVEMAEVDMLFVPTVLQNFLTAEIESEEKPSKGSPRWRRNSLLGRFTNFVNLLDMAAVSVPSGLLRHPDLSLEASGESEVSQRAEILKTTGNATPNLPFGVTLIGPAWSDPFLWLVAAEMHKKSGLGCGPEGHRVKPFRHA